MAMKAFLLGLIAVCCLRSFLITAFEKIEPICTIPLLCEQDTAYTFPSIAQTLLIIPRQNISDGSICVIIIPAHQTHFTSDHFCQPILIVDESMFVTLPFTLDYLFYAHFYTIANGNTFALSWSTIYLPVFLNDVPNFTTKIHVKNLPYGLIDSNQFNVELTQPATTSYAISFSIESLFQTILPTNVDRASTNEETEPGTWFLTLTPHAQETADDAVYVTTSGEQQRPLISGYPTYNYLEFVLSNADIIGQRLFSQYNRSAAMLKDNYDLINRLQRSLNDSISSRSLLHNVSLAINEVDERIHICIWGNKNMDGQRRIWLLQFQHLDPTLFRFTYGLDETEDESKDAKNDENHVLYYLNKDHPSIQVQYRHHHRIELADLSQPSSDGEATADQVWQGNVTRLYEYLHERFHKADGIIDQMEPSWAKEVYQGMARFASDAKCHILIYGNARAALTDSFIVNIGRSLGIPTVTELMNLYLDPNSLPDVIVAPSRHSLMHDSIQQPVKAKLVSNGYTSTGVVIQPAVDLSHFQPERFLNSSTLPFRRAINCASTFTSINLTYDNNTYYKHFPCFLIGFVGRLSVEKNPGLFLQMAYHLYKQLPSARFQFIGDGPLRPNLEQLAKRMQMERFVEFIGWVSYDNLPQHLLDLDLLVNPSLRGWSETFCITNIEAMAMGIPIATFAVGGIGEYVRAPPSNSDSANQESWSVAENALLFNTANPLSMANAVATLLRQPGELRRIAQAGRKVVEEYFNVERQMQQYSELYKTIYAVNYQ